MMITRVINKMKNVNLIVIRVALIVIVNEIKTIIIIKLL